MSERLLTVAEVLAYEAGYDARSEEVTAEIARLTAELDAAREREREANETIDLAWQFVATARRDFRPGDEEYDDCLEQVEDLLWRARKDALASTPPDTEGQP